MEPTRNREGMLWGIPLIAIGLLLLLRNLNLVGSIWDLLWAMLFGAGGLLFLTIFQRNRETGWWALIPAFALFGLMAKGMLEWASPWLGRHFGEASFLAATGVGFGLIYVLRRDQWWTLLPGGALLTLAVQKSTTSLFPHGWGDTLFFLGLSGTFLFLYTANRSNKSMAWTLVAAALFFALAIARVAKAAVVLKFAWPIALITLGVYLMARQMPRRGPHP